MSEVTIVITDDPTTRHGTTKTLNIGNDPLSLPLAGKLVRYITKGKPIPAKWGAPRSIVQGFVALKAIEDWERANPYTITKETETP